MKQTLAYAFACIFVVGSNAWSSQIGMGLRNGGIFLQEYWTPKGPFYLIANSTDQAVRIGFRGHSFHDDGMHFTNPRYGAIVKESTVGAKSYGQFEAVRMDSMMLLNVVVDGKSGGLLNPASEKNLAEPCSGGAVINSYMNYWGGGPDKSLWFECDNVVLKSGKEVRITMAMKANTGSVGFGPYDELGHFISSDPKMGAGSYTYDLPFPLMLPVGAKSSTMAVTRSDKLFAIDSADLASTDPVHRTTLTFRAPQVDKATPVIISGFRHRQPGWGNWITLMLVVEP